MAQLAPKSTHTPWRQIGQFSRVVLIIIGLPYTVLSAFIRRPHPKWTFRQTVVARLIRSYLHMFGRAGVSATLTLEPGKQGDRFQVIDPSTFPKSFYQGPATSPAVTPSKVGGTWYPNQPKDAKTRIILWNHGGAFIMGDSRELYCGFLTKTLLEHARADAVFCLEYRLSGYGQHPYPAALQDMITAYAHLTETLEIPPTSITIGGDSAGANLSIAFMRYLEQNPTGLKRPGSAALVSPWVAPLESLSPTDSYQDQKAYQTDYVAVSNLQLGARTYAPSDNTESSNTAYITPLGHPFATTIPVFAHFGECEVLGPGIVAWVNEMRRTPSNEIELYCEKHAPHDTIASGNILGWEESACEVASEIGKFISAHDRILSASETRDTTVHQ